MILIGEKINASISDIRKIIEARDQERLLELAESQATAGADYIDVNVGTGLGSQSEEIESMEWAIGTIQRHPDTSLCIDSPDPVVLEAALNSLNGTRGLINSAKADEKSLRQVLPLAREYETPLVALAMDENGIPKTVEDRVRACEKIATACNRCGVPLESVFFDPLVLPVSTDIKQGLVTLQTLREIKREFPTAKTVMGLSNVSYGLPGRARLNAAFLNMAVFAGLDAAIMDPSDGELRDAVRTAEVLVGKDRHCRHYTRNFRKSP